MATGFPVKANYATGDILTATNMNDLAGTVNYAVNATPTTATQMAGKNAIINGDFGIWQRGTSFSNPSSDAYNADRWKISYDGTGATRTISQQSFTVGTAPVAGYEGTYFYRCATTVAGTGNTYIWAKQFIEDVRTFAGQTVTLSFWAKADTARTLPNIGFEQYFGSGGSASVYADTANVAITSSWARYTVTVTLASISGKTLGSGNALIAFIKFPTGVATIDIWGVQVESGSSATPFQTATGTKQGELAACQRYFYNGGNTIGSMNTSGQALFIHNLPVPMRTTPSMAFTGTATVSNPGVATYTTTTQPSSISQTQTNNAQIYFAMTGMGATVASGVAYSQTLITLSAEL